MDTSRRLAPGAHAVPEGADGLLLTTPAEEVARVHLPGGDRELLLDVLTGRRTADDALATAADPGLLAEVFDGCAAEGITGPPPAAATGGTVTILGDNPLSAVLMPLLATVGFTVADDGDQLVSCAGWLPDAEWRRLDDERAERPWHRCHVEGTRLVVGPFSVPGAPTYLDTRTRRLAASAWPDELEALWHHLDTATDLPPVPWPDPGVLAVAAGLVVADLVAYRAGHRPPGADRQVVVDPADLAWHAHPVLPLPTGIMRTAA